VGRGKVYAWQEKCYVLPCLTKKVFLKRRIADAAKASAGCVGFALPTSSKRFRQFLPKTLCKKFAKKQQHGLNGCKG
jgi:hypothetical protein